MRASPLTSGYTGTVRLHLARLLVVDQAGVEDVRCSAGSTPDRARARRVGFTTGGTLPVAIWVSQRDRRARATAALAFERAGARDETALLAVLGEVGGKRRKPLLRSAAGCRAPRRAPRRATRRRHGARPRSRPALRPAGCPRGSGAAA